MSTVGRPTILWGPPSRGTHWAEPPFSQSRTAASGERRLRSSGNRADGRGDALRDVVRPPASPQRPALAPDPAIQVLGIAEKEFDSRPATKW